jgi:hypothetical protein
VREVPTLETRMDDVRAVPDEWRLHAVRRTPPSAEGGVQPTTG